MTAALWCALGFTALTVSIFWWRITREDAITEDAREAVLAPECELPRHVTIIETANNVFSI